MATFSRYTGDFPPVELARAGFVHASNSFYCPCCHLELSTLARTDVPIVVHQVLSPTCKFVRELRLFTLSDGHMIDLCRSGPDEVGFSSVHRPSLSITPSSSSCMGRDCTCCAQMTCKVCLTESCEVLFKPCLHLSCCRTCSKKIMNCPICRSLIWEVTRVYIP